MSDVKLFICKHECETSRDCSLDDTGLKCLNNRCGRDCPRGHEYDKKERKCVDIDECKTTCLSNVKKCTNTVGSHKCTCKCRFGTCGENACVCSTGWEGK